jgi:hypothetical protein
MENNNVIYNPVEQVQAADNTSDYYQFIPTSKVITMLSTLGWQKTEEIVTQVRAKNQQGYQKHMVRFSHPDMYWDAETRPELVVVNAHNGKSSLKFMFGIFRMICANGIIAMTKGETFKVLHKGDVEAKIKYAVDGILKLSEARQKAVQNMRTTNLSLDQINQFGAKAARLLMPEEGYVTEETLCGITTPRREEDKGVSLWQVFNVVQENMTRHGFKYVTRKPSELNPEETITKRHRTRGFKSVDKTTLVNAQLWELVDEFRQAA